MEGKCVGWEETTQVWNMETDDMEGITRNEKGMRGIDKNAAFSLLSSAIMLWLPKMKFIAWRA